MQKIKLLMQWFHVSGKDLADVLYVDQSLVSKWCSGTRPLKMGSSHLNSIVDYFIMLDEKDEFMLLRQLMPDTDDLDKNALKVSLKKWITSDDDQNHPDEINIFELSKISKPRNIYSFNGNQGRRDAIAFFESYAANCGPHQEVLTYNSENSSWFYEDISFARRGRMENQRVLDNGGKITMIHPLNTTYQNLAFSLLNWIPLYLSGGSIQGIYMPVYSEDSVNYTYFVIKNKLALIGMSTNRSTEIITLIFTDKTLVNRIEEILKVLVQKGHPLVHFIDDWTVYNNTHDSNLWPWLDQASISKSAQHSINYMFTSQLPFFNLSKEILLDALSPGQISSDEEKRLHDKRWDLLMDENTECRFILYPKVMHDKLKMETVPLDILSRQLGREIRISAKKYRKLLRTVLTIMENAPHYKIGISGPLFDDPTLDYYVYSRYNSGLLFWNAHKYTRMVAVNEMKTTTAVYEFFKSCWDAIPDLQKDKTAVLAYLNDLINAAENEELNKNE